MIEDLMHRLDRRVDVEDWQGALEVALELWRHPTYEAEIVDRRMRDDYVSALFKVADLFQYVAGSPYDTLAPLKRIYELDDGHLVAGADHSAKELAAHKLGNLYEVARCPHSAAEWFRRALVLAEDGGVVSNILRNLHRLAWNLETLDAYEEAGRCYGRMLEILSGMPVQQHPYWLVPAAMYQVHHGDAARGEALMRSLIEATLSRSSGRRADPEPLQVWFLSALRALGMHLITAGRQQEAIDLARLVGRSASRFEGSTWAQEVEHGLAARAFVHVGRLDDALAELDHVFDVEETTFFGYSGPLETLELKGDIARIHVAHGRYEQAMAAYEILAYHLGAYIADPRVAYTTRLRFSWLQQQA
ncbi:MAG TPA: hypothetical protein VLC95_10825, partial [Anaerolineae bacterium]|nr:hypothetical protein [Anaerolineae bacterium]